MPEVAQMIARCGTGESRVVHPNLAATSGSMWAIGAAIFTLSLTAIGTGANPLSSEIARVAQVSPAADAKRKDDFFEHVAEYQVDDWDGAGARAITTKDVNNARTLLTAVAPTSEPDIVAGADGSICMEWVRQSPNGEKKIYVDVGPDGRVLTFARFGDSSPIEKHFDQYGPNVDAHLRVLFSIYSV